MSLHPLLLVRHWPIFDEYKLPSSRVTAFVSFVSTQILFYFFSTVNYWILQEGLNFLQLRIKHLMKTNCIQQAMLLSKICSDSEETSSDSFFRQSFITCLCTMLPDDEAFKEVHISIPKMIRVMVFALMLFLQLSNCHVNKMCTYTDLNQVGESDL